MSDDGWEGLPPVPDGRGSEKERFTVIQGGKSIEAARDEIRKEIKESWSGLSNRQQHSIAATVEFLERVIVVKLPDAEIQDLIKWCVKVDIATRKQLEGHVTKINARIDSVPKVQTDKPIIQWANSDLISAVIEAEKTLVRLMISLFDYGGKLVRLEDNYRGDVRLRLFTEAMMYELMWRTMSWESFDADKGCFVAKKPPKDIASMMLVRNDVWPYRKLRGITQVPLFRLDTGEIIGCDGVHGYDEVTGIYIASDIEIVNVGSAQEALNGLQWLLRETAYDGNESKASTLAGIMTVVLRASLPLAPGWVVIAHEAASGKSALQEVAAILATGSKPYVLAHGGREDEFNKVLNAALLEGRSIIMVDNFNGVIRGELLAQAVSQERLGLRVLGKGEIVPVTNLHSIMFNGNNSELEGEQRRRYIVTYLNPGMENLEEYKYSFDIFDCAKKYRNQLISSIFTIVSAYYSSGTRIKVNELSGFPHWNRLVRESLIWLGLADPLSTGKRAREEDTKEQQKVLMLEELYVWATTTWAVERKSGNHIIQPGEFLTKELTDALLSQSLPQGLKDVVRDVAEERGFINNKKLGHFIGKELTGIVRNGKVLERRYANGRWWNNVRVL